LAVPSPIAIAARSRLEPGDIAAIVRLHGREAAEHGLDASFEAEVARGLTDLAIAWTRSPDAGRLWLAGPPEDPLWSIAITRERADLARLRWFMVARPEEAIISHARASSPMRLVRCRRQSLGWRLPLLRPDG